METEGTDDPEQGAPSGGPLPPPAQAPRPAEGPTTGGIPSSPSGTPPSEQRPAPGPVEVGDPTGGATSSATIGGSGPAIARPADGDSGGPLSGDWPAQATDTIVNVVGAVRDRTTGPVTTAARSVVFGLLASLLAVAVAVLLVIVLVRLLDEALPSGVWVAYLILGALFALVGALVFHQRKAGNTGPA